MYTDYARDHIVQEEIIPGLFLGNIYAANVFEGAIVSLCETKYVSDNVMKLYIPDEEGYGIRRHFRDTNTFIYENMRKGIPVLIHCRMGISRSVTILTAYLMRAYLIDTGEALTMIQGKRPDAQPNRGFMMDLYAYQNYIYKLRNR